MVSITKWIFVAIGVIVFALFVNRARTVGIGQAGTEVGQGIGSIGQGIGSFGSGLGAGVSGIVKPFGSILDLFGRAGNLFGVGGAVSPATARKDNPAVWSPTDGTGGGIGSTGGTGGGGYTPPVGVTWRNFSQPTYRQVREEAIRSGGGQALHNVLINRPNPLQKHRVAITNQRTGAVTEATLTNYEIDAVEVSGRTSVTRLD